MTDMPARTALAGIDRRLLLAGLGATAFGVPTATRAADADAGLLVLERRLRESMSRRDEALAARTVAERGYLARRRERPACATKPPRDEAETVAAARMEAGLGRSQTEWARGEAALRRGTARDALAAKARALVDETDALAGEILARPAATAAGLAAKARLARLTGDARFAWSVVEDLLRTAELVNAT